MRECDIENTLLRKLEGAIKAKAEEPCRNWQTESMAAPSCVELIEDGESDGWFCTSCWARSLVALQ